MFTIMPEASFNIGVSFRIINNIMSKQLDRKYHILRILDKYLARYYILFNFNQRGFYEH